MHRRKHARCDITPPRRSNEAQTPAHAAIGHTATRHAAPARDAGTASQAAVPPPAQYAAAPPMQHAATLPPRHPQHAATCRRAAPPPSRSPRCSPVPAGAAAPATPAPAFAEDAGGARPPRALRPPPPRFAPAPPRFAPAPASNRPVFRPKERGTRHPPGHRPGSRAPQGFAPDCGRARVIVPAHPLGLVGAAPPRGTARSVRSTHTKG